MRVKVTAPCRADLAGGTLDIWPLPHLFPGSATINVALDAFAELLVEDGRERWEVEAEGEGHAFAGLDDLCASPWALFGEILKAAPPATPVRITVLRQPPPRSGLGGSSAVAAALARAAAALRGEEPGPEALIALCRDAEVAVMGYPTGVQDYYPPFYGGVNCIRYLKGRTERGALPLFPGLAEGLVFYHTGVPHHSGANNWQVVKRAVEDKTSETHKCLGIIAELTARIEAAFGAGDLARIGRLVMEEWRHRVRLHPAFAHMRIDQAVRAVIAAGAYGGKGCGAAGGGAVVVVTAPDRRAAVEGALLPLPGRLLDIHPTAEGMRVEAC
jgi:D-glycero-alpha-D-manno-heptose-7-phosphate kinase